jgi:LuxR family maltose regulon positive regulatory protein
MTVNDGQERRRVLYVVVCAAPPASDVHELELTVLRLLPTQLRTPEIAQELSVSVNTIRSQIQAIYRKLQASSRAEAVTKARHLRLLP